MLPQHKTKIVCTIGPASVSPDVLKRLIEAGMNVARINFSHGDFAGHKQAIANIRAASRATGRRVAIMADLPGPKIRIGQIENEPIELKDGDRFSLTTEEINGNADRVSVSFRTLPKVVKAGNIISLNDGFIQLEVESVNGNDVHCIVQVGGELRSRKGLNLPGIDLGISAFTDKDYDCLEFAIQNGVDAVSQSFVASANDIQSLRKAISELGGKPFIIAKIERAGALDEIDAILDATDGIMVARGDLGVELPIEQMAVIQKGLMEKANRLGKPVITATHMLESMVEHRRPTRAEATDVANAILDGTDCVMLSGESAMGKHPVESAAMLAKIATSAERHRSENRLTNTFRTSRRGDKVKAVDIISLSVQHSLQRFDPVAIVVPTLSGMIARSIARFRPQVSITAFSPNESTCQALQFSYGVNAVHVDKDRADWDSYTREWLATQGINEGLALLTQGPSEQHPDTNHRLEILDLGRDNT